MEGGSVTLVLDELYEVRQADSELPESAGSSPRNRF